MRIAYLSTFYPFRGGIAQFNAAVYKALENLNHEVNAYTFTTQYPSFLFPGETQFVKENDNVEKIPAQRILSTVNPFSYHSAAKKIKQNPPDLLLMKYWMSFFAPSLGYVAGKIKSDTKIITILDNVIPHEKKFYDKAFTRYFLKKNTAFIAMSDKVKNDLLSFNKNARVKLVPHPLYDHFGELRNKIQSKQELGLNPDKKTILFFGFIRDYKGLDLLIDAFSRCDNSIQLLIAGEVYGSFDKYRKLIDINPRKADIHSHIKYISDVEVPLYFSAADACILPYKSATQSGITGISYHFEVPVIATDVGGLSEIVKHEKTGLIVKNATSDAIAESINDFFSTEKSEYFRNNIKELKEELSWHNFAKEIIKMAE